MGEDRCEVRMKKIIISLIFITVLAACSNTPDTINLDATVNAAVKSAVETAVAPYEAKTENFVTNEDLAASQKEQSVQIQQYVLEQIERAKSDEDSQPAEATETSDVTVFVNNGVKSTATPVAYSYDNKNCVDDFAFISDITVPDGMTIPPNTLFPKTWYIKNTGTCIWNSGYKVSYIAGDVVSAEKSFPLLGEGYFIKPGESTVATANLYAPNMPNTSFSTSWALESDKGVQFGSGPAKNLYLSSNFYVQTTFDLIQNIGSIKCSDNYGSFTCGVQSNSSGRGTVYYDSTLMTENGRSHGLSGLAVIPPAGENNVVRFEFGPLRFPRGSYFYTNFSCRPEAQFCDTQVRLYVREPGYAETFVVEKREWYDGFIGELKFKLDDMGIFDQDFYYILEVQSNGGSEGDTIMFWNTKLY